MTQHPDPQRQMARIVGGVFRVLLLLSFYGTILVGTMLACDAATLVICAARDFYRCDRPDLISKLTPEVQMLVHGACR